MWLDVEISSSKVYRTLHKHVVYSEVLAGTIIGVPGLVGTPGCVCVCGRGCSVALRYSLQGPHYIQSGYVMFYKT